MPSMLLEHVRGNLDVLAVMQEQLIRAGDLCQTRLPLRRVSTHGMTGGETRSLTPHSDDGNNRHTGYESSYNSGGWTFSLVLHALVSACSLICRLIRLSRLRQVCLKLFDVANLD